MTMQYILQVNQIILLQMRQTKQKQQPFFVKRIRLRKSVIKTNQILQMISNYDQQSSKFATISESFRRDDKALKIDINKLSQDKSEQGTFCSSRIQKSNLKNMVKIYKHRNNNQMAAQMTKIGLQVRRIVGDPRHKKSYQYSCNTIDRQKSKQATYSNARLNLTFSNKLTVDAQSLKNDDETEKNMILLKMDEKNVEKFCTDTSSFRKNRAYLYEKMANKQISLHHEQNYVYDKRIKSYTEFLWKCLLAHNVYINLDLKLPNNNFKKLKAYVGYGNNCNMIKGLLKRRFWWVIAEQMTEDCVFVWNQIKINKIYQRQQRAQLNQTIFKEQFYLNSALQRFNIVQSSGCERRSLAFTMDKTLPNQKNHEFYQSHHKILNNHDFHALKISYKPLQTNSLLNDIQFRNKKNKNYKTRTQEINKITKQITFLDSLSKCQSDSSQKHNYYIAKPLVHNHLENNFFLGNKKALFYNLRQYYQKIGENAFAYVPLTFHIRNGFKDPEYDKFTKFYQKRAKAIKQQEGTDRRGKKMRNIWIVKPGQNSNQGRGITVIDEIYELNTIIKQSIPKQSSRRNDKQEKLNADKKTIIVQLYIDRPFLYFDRKFDIRHYMLITNLYGVTRAYWYEEGYIRTSSYLFNINNFEPQIHLTNDAIQKKYPEYGRYQPYNKISYAQYQNYLNTIIDRKYNFKQQILTKMKKMAKDAARSVYTKISPQNQMHNFQIFGLDFMIDRNFKPWLIQINTNPCLDCTCPLLDRIIPYMVEQGLKLSLDLVYPPPSHYPNTNKHYAPLINLETFKYQLIFDSLSQGQQLRKLYSKNSNNLLSSIGPIEDDEQFKDNGKQIKLEDFT